jgi:hypothetical protein
MSQVRFAGAIVGLALLVAGCGGASATAKFSARVNAICALTNRQLGALQAPGKAVAGSGNAGIERLVAKEIPIDDAEVDRLASLTAPAQERVAYKDAVAQARNDVALVPKILAAMRANNQTALDSITLESSALSDLAIAAMKRLDFRTCARNL